VAGFRIDVEGLCPPIVVNPCGEFTIHYDQPMKQTFIGRIEDHTWRAFLRCAGTLTPMAVRHAGKMVMTYEGVRLTLSPGRNDILVAVGGPIDVSAEESLRATTAWWHSTWADSAWLDLPDEAAQKVWVRSLAYVLCSHNDDGLGCPPPNGLTGAGWPFTFPFDSACCHPLLLWTGRIDAARKWVEFWSGHSEGLSQYTRRLWKRDGIMLPHVFPYGPMEGLHDPEPPNRYYYPIYNGGLLARIAHQAAVMVNDPEWTRRYALPLINGAARFYLDIANKGDDGLWHFTVIPSIGLDESGGSDQPDYICTLVAAEYAFRAAIEHGLDSDGRMAGILRDGLAYKALLSDRGLYYANGGTGGREFGRQKHPDQFFPLVNVPVWRAPDSPTRRLHELRYELTDRAKEPCFIGHTGGEFILASTRMHDAEAWRKDWGAVQPARYADPDWVQFYESSGNRLTYYVTTHGLFGQAILETVVSTWWGRLDLGACVPWPGRVRFGNVRTLLGVTVSGEFVDGRGTAVLRAWKDTSLQCQGKTLALKKGEEARVTVGSEVRGEQ
jgi:hypothetical protein